MDILILIASAIASIGAVIFSIISLKYDHDTWLDKAIGIFVILVALGLGALTYYYYINFF